ncbi:uncharacterized protein [Ptychodera flava]|uniref:uncharacterized protein n=1 Tax=Ptychodera flava TaxID=63121 RepID=UPI00396A2E67
MKSSNEGSCNTYESGVEEMSCGSSYKPKKKKNMKNADKRVGRLKSKRACIEPGCKAKVVHLKRHLVKLHKYDDLAALVKVTSYSKKKRIHEKKDKGRPFKECPLDCDAVIKRIDKHLINKHKLDPQSDLYKWYVLESAVKCRQESRRKRMMAGSKSKKMPEQGQLSSSKKQQFSESFTKPFNPLKKRKITEKDRPIAAPQSQGASSSISRETEDQLEKFNRYLTSLEGGICPRELATQHSDQVKQMINMLTGKVECLGDRKMVENLVQKMFETMRLTTVRSYLYSVSMFYSFQDAQPKPVITNTKEMRNTVVIWRSSFRKGGQQCKANYQDEQMHEMIMPKEVLQYSNSEQSKKVIKLVAHYQQVNDGTVIIPVTHFALMRSYIMVSLTLDTTQRSEVMRRITIGDFREAIKQGNKYIVTAKKLKTSSINGAARITFSDHLHSVTSVFINKVLSRTAGGAGPERHLFSNYDGLPLKSSVFNRRLNGNLKRSKVSLQALLATKSRKSVVTMVYHMKPELEKSPASSMSHREVTHAAY